MRTALLESHSAILNSLLESVTGRLQLSNTQHGLAVEHYESIHDWLAAQDSPLLRFDPWLYPQGSMLLKTTVRPTSYVEYDLDIVCLLRTREFLLWSVDAVYELVAQRLEHNGVYASRLVRKPRCIRIEYAHNFHLDLIPACPDPDDGGTAIVVADRNEGRWIRNNPKAFAQWFETRSTIARYAYESVRAKAEPIPDLEPAIQKAVLRRVVQLWKRHRDVSLQGKSFSPASIVLTTLAGEHYDGTPICAPALVTILDAVLDMARCHGPRFVLRNPVDSREDLVSKWTNADFSEFVRFTRNFREELQVLREETGLPRITEHLKRLFGDDCLPDLTTLGSDLRRLLDERKVNRVPSLCVLTTNPNLGRPVRPSTFYGS